MTIFAIAKLLVKAISRFPHFTANCCALFIVSLTTAVNVGDWLIVGRYHLFSVVFLSIRCCAFQPSYIRIDFGRMLNWIIHNKSLTFASWYSLESVVDLYIPAASVQRLRFLTSYDKARYPHQSVHRFFFSFFLSLNHHLQKDDSLVR